MNKSNKFVNEKTSHFETFYLSIRALNPDSLVNPFPKKCVVAAQRLSTFDTFILLYKTLNSTAYF